MVITHIFYWKKFLKQYKKLPPNIKTLAEEKEQIFLQDPFDPRLKTHKLSGRLDGWLAFSINHDYRIIFDLQNSHTARFYMIGTHEIYK